MSFPTICPHNFPQKTSHIIFAEVLHSRLPGGFDVDLPGWMGRPLADCHHLFGGASEPAGRDAVNAVNAVNSESHGDFWGKPWWNPKDNGKNHGKIYGKSMEDGDNVGKWMGNGKFMRIDGNIYDNVMRNCGKIHGKSMEDVDIIWIYGKILWCMIFYENL